MRDIRGGLWDFGSYCASISTIINGTSKIYDRTAANAGRMNDDFERRNPVVRAPIAPALHDECAAEIPVKTTMAVSFGFPPPQ